MSFYQPVNTHVCNVVAASQHCASCGYTKRHTEASTLSGVRFVERAVSVQVILGDTWRRTRTRPSINAPCVIGHSATYQVWKDTSNTATTTLHWHHSYRTTSYVAEMAWSNRLLSPNCLSLQAAPFRSSDSVFPTPGSHTCLHCGKKFAGIQFLHILAHPRSCAQRQLPLPVWYLWEGVSYYE